MHYPFSRCLYPLSSKPEITSQPAEKQGEALDNAVKEANTHSEPGNNGLVPTDVSFINTIFECKQLKITFGSPSHIITTTVHYNENWTPDDLGQQLTIIYRVRFLGAFHFMGNGKKTLLDPKIPLKMQQIVEPVFFEPLLADKFFTSIVKI